MPGPGTHLKRLLSWFAITPSGECECDQHAAEMDEKGTAWCRENAETIVDWLEAEAAARRIPFVRLAGHLFLRQALSNAECDDISSQESYNNS